jgi:Farnesoic acid 0-methyl transferase
MWYSTVDDKTIVFRVQACSDAHILLAQYFMTTDYGVYEIVLGTNSNRQSVIRNGLGGPVLVEQNTDNVLQCGYSQWFWIDWSRGISVGSGYQVGDSQILNLDEVPDGNFDVKYIAVATGQNVQGDWDFTSVPGILESSPSIFFQFVLQKLQPLRDTQFACLPNLWSCPSI